MILYTEEQIKKRVHELANMIESDFQDTQITPVFLGVLNGSFIFMADLIRAYNGACEIDFCRIKSYKDNQIQASVFIKANEIDISGRHVVIIEDIVETGSTLNLLTYELKKQHPEAIFICSLFKRQTCKLKVDYVGFVLNTGVYIYGYGLDNKNLDRNLKEVRI
jgi:hypoxanthine phosphoribosyltransferase